MVMSVASAHAPQMVVNVDILENSYAHAHPAIIGQLLNKTLQPKSLFI